MWIRIELELIISLYIERSNHLKSSQRDFDILKWEIEKIESSLTDYCESMQLQKRMFLNCRFCLPQVALSLMIVALCAKLLMVRTMLQSTKTFDTKLVRYIEWSNVQPWVHHISPIWPHYGHFGPKNSHIWPYLAIGSPSCPKLVEHWLNMVEHRSPHLGWATWTPLHPPKWPWGVSEGPQNGHF